MAKRSKSDYQLQMERRAVQFHEHAVLIGDWLVEHYDMDDPAPTPTELGEMMLAWLENADMDDLAQISDQVAAWGDVRFEDGGEDGYNRGRSDQRDDDITEAPDIDHHPWGSDIDKLRKMGIEPSATVGWLWGDDSEHGTGQRWYLLDRGDIDRA